MLGYATFQCQLQFGSLLLNKTHIVFAYAGDLWSGSRDGGDAVRITSGAGNETEPAFSPNGARIAFTGECDGNVDVFVVPASGGVPKRLTWHPAPDRVIGWTPDGKNVIFTSTRSAYSRYSEMFTVPADGGVEQKLPLPTGYGASMSADGQSIAYEPILRSFGMWKEYRGGSTSRIWLARLSGSSVTPVPRTNSNDFNPMWAGDRVYFISDRNGPATILCTVPDGVTQQRATEPRPNTDPGREDWITIDLRPAPMPRAQADCGFVRPVS